MYIDGTVSVRIEFFIAAEQSGRLVLIYVNQQQSRNVGVEQFTTRCAGVGAQPLGSGLHEQLLS